MGVINWFERLLSGDVFYTEVGSGNPDWANLSDKIKTSKSNPILLPAIQLIADYFSSAKFYEVINGKEVDDTPIIEFLKQPNPLQTGDDFLKQHIWYKYSCGFNYTLPIQNALFDKNDIKGLEYMYNLQPDLSEFKDDFWFGLLYTKEKAKKFYDQTLYYDRKNKDISLRREIKLGDLLPFYDTANGLNGNPLTAPSRLDALKMPLSNIEKAFEAKNVVIQTNGKEMITNESSGQIAKIPIKKGERDDIAKKLRPGRTGKYGVGGFNKERAIVTNSALKYQSLHIVLKELGLDDSVIADALIIINAFNIPPELFQVNGKSATFENQEKAVVHFLQSKIQRELNDFCNTINNRYGTTLIAKLDHLPIMQSINKSKIATLRSFAFALEKLVTSLILTVAEAKAEYFKYVEKI